MPYMVETSPKNNQAHVLRLYPNSTGVSIIDTNEPGLNGAIFLTWEKVRLLMDMLRQ